MKMFKNVAVGMFSLAFILGVLALPNTSKAQTAVVGPNGGTVISGQPYTGLGDLFVLDQLFGGNTGAVVGPNGAVIANQGLGLGNLFVLDRLFAPPTAIIGANGAVVSGGGSFTSLGDLFILDQLFNRGPTVVAPSTGLY